MAGDWIKVRVWLAKDPKVISMADFLATDRGFIHWLTDPVRASCKESAYEHVTRCVTVSVTVTGLVTVWGVTREQGVRSGDDLLVPCASLETLDEVAGVPGFGAAMAWVGWAIEDQEKHSVTLPKFFREQVSTADRLRLQAVDRKRRQRVRDSSVTVTRDRHVTDRDMSRLRGEERREEEETPQSPPAGGAPPGMDPSHGPEKTKSQKRKGKPVWHGTVPKALAVERFEGAWQRWLRFRSEELRKPVTQLSGDQALQELAGWGVERACTAIDHTIARGWQGLREPEPARNGGLDRGEDKTKEQHLREAGLL